MNDPLSSSMLWVGALMVLAPLAFAGIVIGVWWYVRKKAERQKHQAMEGDAGR